MVSTAHTNYLVNLGNASFQEMIQLIEKIKKDAKEKMNIDLECEWEIIDQPIPFYIYKHKLILEEIK